MLVDSRRGALLLAVALTSLSRRARAEDAQPNPPTDKPGVIAAGIVASALGAGQAAFGTVFLVDGLGGTGSFARGEAAFGGAMVAPGAAALLAGVWTVGYGAAHSSRSTVLTASVVTLVVGSAVALGIPVAFAVTPDPRNDPAAATIPATFVGVAATLLVEGGSLLVYALTRTPTRPGVVQVSPMVTSDLGGIAVTGSF
jgi:hypothetical protein